MVLFYLCIDTIEEVHFTKYYVTNNYGYMERGKFNLLSNKLIQN